MIGAKPLVRNTVYNLCGYGLPLFAAYFTIPLIINGLGTARFGILTLAWVLIGYLGLFDMGFGRALTQLVAEKLGSEKYDEIPTLIWTAILVMGIIGFIVGTLSSFVLPWVIRHLLKIPPNLAPEAETAFFLIGVFVPFIIVSVGFRGILDAYQRFDLTNMIRIPLGLFTFIAPVVILKFSNSLIYVMIFLMAGRVVAMMFQLGFCLRVVKNLKKAIRFDTTIIEKLMKFGGWMTITNIISPLMIYLDRFFIGAIISLTAVTYYATPSEVITKLLLISGALMGVLFPAFSSTFQNRRDQAGRLFSVGLNGIYLVMFPILIVILAFAKEGLNYWLGTQFSDESQQALKLMALSVFFISLGQVPYALIQGAGRPDITAKIHLIELPLYLCLLWPMIQQFGINGAACAWMLRSAIDSSLLYLISCRILGHRRIIGEADRFITASLFLVAAIIVGFFSFSFYTKMVVIFFTLIFHFLLGWLVFLNQREKEIIKGWLVFAPANHT